MTVTSPTEELAALKEKLRAVQEHRSRLVVDNERFARREKIVQQADSRVNAAEQRADKAEARVEELEQETASLKAQLDRAGETATNLRARILATRQRVIAAVDTDE